MKFFAEIVNGWKHCLKCFHHNQQNQNQQNQNMNILQKSSMTPRLASKSFWFILKTFLNAVKILFIPLLIVTNHLVTDFKLKENLFNDFLAG